MSNQRIFSRLPSMNGKWVDTPGKVNEAEVKRSYIKPMNWWANDFQMVPMVPPPPRPPFIVEELVSDGLTTCDLCGWAYDEKNFYSLEGLAETSNSSTMWIVILLIVVSVSSAVIGAIIMITAIKYKRSNAIRAFGARNCGIKKDFSPDRLSNEQKQQQSEMKNVSMDMKFFMEENTENDEAFYATLDDQDSINSNDVTYPKLKSDEPAQFSSAPSSAYYSDLSNPTEKQYESIDNFTTFDKSDFNKSSNSFITLNNNNVITNRLSAISENNFSSHNRDVNSDYV